MVHRHFGIDTAKDTFQVRYLSRKTETQKSFANSPDGFEELPAWAKKHDPAFRAYAERIKDNGHKSKKTIATACARKLMHVVWALLKHKQDYDPKIFMEHAKLT